MYDSVTITTTYVPNFPILSTNDNLPVNIQLYSGSFGDEERKLYEKSLISSPIIKIMKQNK